MMKQTAGKIYFDGKLLDRKDLSEIGALIENTPIYENLAAGEYVYKRQVSNVSHVFKTPINAIEGYTMLLSLIHI